jgi:predicted dehydrogenase
MAEINVGLIGQGFMGRSHSNAWGQVNRYCNPAINPVMHTVAGLPGEDVEGFAKRWGWQNPSTDWKATIANPEIGLVDIVTPNFMHMPPAVAALEAGKPVACEKPIAGTLSDARQMAKLAEEKGLPTFVWFNYRRAPAVAFAHKLIKSGELGRILHVRARYLQDWAGEDVPMAWRFKKELAGSGAHGDLNAHIVDITRFVAGVEVEEICGAYAETLIKQRKVLVGGTGAGISQDELIKAGANSGDKYEDVTVDDTVAFLVRYTNGAVGTYEAARQATGHKNDNTFEINGTKGSLRFSFERMNELEYYDARLPQGVQGWSTILCTNASSHPYVANYWPDGHLIGYEHCFISQALDICNVLAGKEAVVPLPSFNDAYQTQRVLEAAMLAATEKRFVKMEEVF